MQVPVGDPVLCGRWILCDSFLLPCGPQRGQHSDFHPRRLPSQLGRAVVCHIRPTNVQVSVKSHQQALRDHDAEGTAQVWLSQEACCLHGRGVGAHTLKVPPSLSEAIPCGS